MRQGTAEIQCSTLKIRAIYPTVRQERQTNRLGSGRGLVQPILAHRRASAVLISSAPLRHATPRKKRSALCKICPYPGHTLNRGSAICGGALLEKRQQVHFGVPAGDLNQRRMGGENAEYLAGAE
jgi:hypothetical protein